LNKGGTERKKGERERHTARAVSRILLRGWGRATVPIFMYRKGVGAVDAPDFRSPSHSKGAKMKPEGGAAPLPLNTALHTARTLNM
jgi:hypothetical protein